MKFSIKDWFFLFLAVLLGGLGILEGIESTLGIILVAIGSMGILVILCHKFFDLWRNYGKYEKVTEKQTAAKQNQIRINERTCVWLQKYGIWKHKTSSLYYCPHCSPDPSPLSNDNNKSWFCHKCKNGFGEGEVFTVN